MSDWGVVTVGPFRRTQRVVRKGDELLARYRVLVHDGGAQDCDAAGRYDRFVNRCVFGRGGA